MEKLHTLIPSEFNRIPEIYSGGDKLTFSVVPSVLVSASCRKIIWDIRTLFRLHKTARRIRVFHFLIVQLHGIHVARATRHLRSRKRLQT